MYKTKIILIFFVVVVTMTSISLVQRQTVARYSDNKKRNSCQTNRLLLVVYQPYPSIDKRESNAHIMKSQDKRNLKRLYNRERTTRQSRPRSPFTDQVFFFLFFLNLFYFIVIIIIFTCDMRHLTSTCDMGHMNIRHVTHMR